MLMQNFKSAADLGITEPQLSALQKTLVLLETGRMIHAPGIKSTFKEASTFTGHFNMDQWSIDTPCGTVCCIGGTAELVGGLPRESFEAATVGNGALYSLFYPTAVQGDWGDITPAQAATALRSYLTTGDAKWHEAVA